MKSKILFLVLLSMLFIGCKALQKQPTEIGACKILKEPSLLCVNGEYVALTNIGLVTPEYAYTRVHLGEMNICTCKGVENDDDVEANSSGTPYLEIAE